MLDRSAEGLGKQMLEVVETQLRENDPPETRSTLDRLVKAGHSKLDAKKMIACVIVAQMFEIAQNSKPYDHDWYLAALDALPTLPD